MTSPLLLYDLRCDRIYQMIIHTHGILPHHCRSTDRLSLVQYQACKSLHGRCGLTLTRGNTGCDRLHDGYAARSSDCGRDLRIRDTLCHSPAPLEATSKWEKNISNCTIPPSSRSHRMEGRDHRDAPLAHRYGTRCHGTDIWVSIVVATSDRWGRYMEWGILGTLVRTLHSSQAYWR